VRKVQKILPAALDSELISLGKANSVMRRWEEVVGATLASRSCPDRYDRGVIWVAVEGSAWAQELRLMKHKILSKLSEFAGHPGLFTDIRFGVRKLPVREESPSAKVAEERTPAEKELSITDIAKRRLENWRDVNPN